MESRIIDLEMRFMHQESLLQELNDVVISQQKNIEDLLKEVNLLKKQLRTSTQSIIRDPSEETPPPHY